ncbi:hypothetical protein AM571_CH02174 [Rhizobium etli 8C-3]|uniref:Uncharacterized protein n=1 Tax=Rhizobium etli 8C-3 TaxID=538025 RepID=A0A1L5P4C1_RHIET|nr:hypothetical protein AM571_CH02174 [Rhizobium etli 8C-3]
MRLNDTKRHCLETAHFGLSKISADFAHTIAKPTANADRPQRGLALIAGPAS